MYPLEWLAKEESSELFAHDLEDIEMIEPPWKLILGNKAILPLLWEMFPDHENLLPSYFIDP
jgi:glutathionylspermidine synthase